MIKKIDSFQGEYRWLSNFWPCHVYLDEHCYTSVEAAYVAAKTLNPVLRQRVREMTDVRAVKRFGRVILLRSDWEQIKLPVMLYLLRQKFTVDSELGNKLIATGSLELIEGNAWGDTFWGTCRGMGQNNLGKLLMKVRNEISH